MPNDVVRLLETKRWLGCCIFWVLKFACGWKLSYSWILLLAYSRPCRPPRPLAVCRAHALLNSVHLRMAVHVTIGPHRWAGSISSHILGVFVTREHVRHNKSGIAHRGRTGMNHLRELPTKLNHFCSGGQVSLPNRTREPQVCLWSAGCREVGGAASNT
jgi:hypothetical protein